MATTTETPAGVAIEQAPFRRHTIATPIWLEREMTLPGRPRGFHLITDEVVSELPELRSLRCGIAHIFIAHTSAALTVNENIASEVLADFRSWFDESVPEDAAYWTHTEEGPDDMPAHIKSSLLGPSVSVPIRQGRLRLGRYQGIYLCEHRDGERPRTLVLTAWGH